MKIHESAENYLETILILQKRKGVVRSIDIVNELGYSKPSVSVAMKNLRKNEYIEVNEHGHISLCESGRQIAVKMLERHNIISSYLCALGVDADQADEDACRIEHIISEETFSALKQNLDKIK